MAKASVFLCQISELRDVETRGKQKPVTLEVV